MEKKMTDFPSDFIDKEETYSVAFFECPKCLKHWADECGDEYQDCPECGYEVNPYDIQEREYEK